MGRISRDRMLFIALLATGMAALALSFALTPTPDEYVRLQAYGRVRVDPQMQTVDYLIMALRVGGAVAFIAGAYLTYRSVRPDRIEQSEDQPDHTYQPYAHIPPEGGNPGARSGIG